MKARAAILLTSSALLVLAGCAAPSAYGTQPAPVPPPWAELDRTVYNNQQVASFVSRDPGWQAWLNAILMSEHANDDLVDASRYNTPVMGIIQAITAAQDAYKVATSFNLPPFTVTSSCRNLYPETNGYVHLSDGLSLRYSLFMTETSNFANGSSCLTSTGLVDEVDSSRGLPVATVERGMRIDWQGSFSRYLSWHQPYWKIATGTTLSVKDLTTLIEK